MSLLSLRVGTKFGVVSHTFRVETKLDLVYWIKAISQCLQGAVVRVKEVIFRKFQPLAWKWQIERCLLSSSV